VTFKYFNVKNGLTTGNITLNSSNSNVTANYFSGTGAVLSGNVTANYFIGDGGFLSNLSVSTGNSLVNGNSNVSVSANGNVSISVAGTANVAEFTSSNMFITGNIIPAANVTYDLGNNTRRFKDLYLSGNTLQIGGGTITIDANSMVLTNPQGGTFVIDGSNAAFASLASYVTEGNQSNITSVGTLSNLTVSGNVSFTGNNVSLGSVANLKIQGGSSNQFLQTDGTGNLTWATASTGNLVNTITVDTFTGNGSQTSFTLSVSPSSVNDTTVNYNGVTLLRQSYTISGANIIFDSAPANGSQLEVTTVQLAASGPGSFTTRTFTGNGSQTNYTVTSGCTASSVVVALDGVMQVPLTDYTVDGTTLTFAEAPANGVSIQIRELGVATSLTSVTTGKSIAMAIVFGF